MQQFNKLMAEKRKIVDITEKLMKPINETKYLTAENYQRYRVIMRYFYLQYEQTKYWLYQEEVYDALVSEDFFKNYTIEQCKQDLESLKNWKNLSTIQDTRRVGSIEDFKNRNYRYQLTEYSIEIERLTFRLEKIFSEGASLEPTLLERLRIQLEKIEEIWDQDEGIVYGWWDGVKNDFIRLNQNYKDYLRDVSSLKSEEMLKAKGFLIFKERLVEYLRTFIKGLQVNGTVIEATLKNISDERIESILNKIVLYELSIPRFTEEVEPEVLYDQALGNWNNLKNWFVETETNPSESNRLYDITGEMIRKMTRYAIQIGEIHRNGANRRSEYAKVLEIFGKCKNIKEAHTFSAMVFGIEKPLHFKGDFQRETDSSSSGVFEEESPSIRLKPRVQYYREKSKPSGIRDYTNEKIKVREENRKKIEKETKIIREYVVGGIIDFKNLPVIKPFVRQAFLRWLSKALETPGKFSKTEEGICFFVEEPMNNEKCTLFCEDGNFIMPAFKICFKDGDVGGNR